MGSEFPQRKRTRLKNFNYSWTGSYFLTICAKDKKCIFGTVTKEYIENDNPDALEQKIPVGANVSLSFAGKTVLKFITSGQEKYENIEVEKFVIMPNHIHLLLYVYGGDEHSPSSAAEIPKYVSSLKHLVNKECGENVFQRSYYDHIVRNDKDFDKIWDYIEGNPVSWQKDCFYVETEKL